MTERAETTVDWVRELVEQWPSAKLELSSVQNEVERVARKSEGGKGRGKELVEELAKNGRVEALVSILIYWSASLKLGKQTEREIRSALKGDEQRSRVLYRAASSSRTAIDRRVLEVLPQVVPESEEHQEALKAERQRLLKERKVLSRFQRNLIPEPKANQQEKESLLFQSRQPRRQR